MATRNVCRICGQPVKFILNRGYVHIEAGGGTIMMRCRKCGWLGAPAKPTVQCPQCKSRDVVDDHCVFAVNADALADLEGER